MLIQDQKRKIRKYKKSNNDIINFNLSEHLINLINCHFTCNNTQQELLCG